MGRAAKQTPQAHALLSRVRDRNSNLEIQFEDEDGVLVVAKCRVIELDDQYVYLDEPQCIGRDLKLRPRQQIDAYLTVDETLYVFRASVNRLKCLVKLNDRKRVVGVVLERPRNIAAGQRRRYFRVSLLGQEPVPVKLHGALNDGSGATAIETWQASGSLINLSVSGAAVRVDNVAPRVIPVDSNLFLNFHLPGNDEPFRFMARVRQVREIDQGIALRVGIDFMPKPSRRYVQIQQRLVQKFVTEIQREHLKRAG